MIHHGQLYLRDHVPPQSNAFGKGRFGRLFTSPYPTLPDTPDVRATLHELGKAGGPMDAQGSPNPDNPDIPAGFTFLGQFLDHDLTFDPTSSLERQNDPEALENFRTPAFELDSVYGSGRAASPHMYDADTGRVKFLLEDIGTPGKQDVPRNSQNTALIGDPRNDENVIVSQLQLAFLKFHNAVVDQVMADGISDPNQAFPEAQRLVRWHYQWIVLHHFLRRTVGDETWSDVLGVGQATTNRKFFGKPRHKPYIPVEFSVAAYRFGHSQVRGGYTVNPGFAAGFMNAALNPLDLDPNDLRGGKRAARRFVEWDNFFEDLGGSGGPQLSKMIDTKLSSPLLDLPFNVPGTPGGNPTPTNPASLAERNLLRGLTFSLPSGQYVAEAMSGVLSGTHPGTGPGAFRVLGPGDLADLASLGAGLAERTPLWFYILREAEVLGGGRRLGPVGGRIVAEVFIGLLEDDASSFMATNSNWKPTLGSNDDFTMADLLSVAGVA